MVHGSAPPAPSMKVPVKPRPVQVRQEFLPLGLPAPTIYQSRRLTTNCSKYRHQKSKTGVSVAPQKDTCPPKIKKTVWIIS